MKKTTILLLLAVVFALSLGTGGVFYWLDKGHKEAVSQASEGLNQGIDLFRKSQYKESLEILQGIPNGILRDWHLPYYTASTLVMLKDFEAAANEYEEALVLNPNEPLILFALGVTYYKLGKLDLAKGYFAAVLEIDPGHEEAKGLMDIMARLERQQSGDNENHEAGDDTSIKPGH